MVDSLADEEEVRPNPQIRPKRAEREQSEHHKRLGQLYVRIDS